jgi:hypothetical protein
MAGTIITDRIESDSSYASRVEIASPVLVTNTFGIKSTGGTGNFNFVGANTNTDRTFTLPDNAGDILTSASDLAAAQLTGNVAAARIATALETSSFAAANLTGRVPAANASLGSVIQVVSTTKTDTFSASIASASNADVTGLSATITPTSSNSKIMVFATVVGHGGSEGGVTFNVKRNGSFIGVPSGSSSYDPILAGNLGVANQSIQGGSTATILDAPNTTSQLTYQVSVVSIATNTRTHYVNRSEDGTRNLGVSSITVMEIAA